MALELLWVDPGSEFLSVSVAGLMAVQRFVSCLVSWRTEYQLVFSFSHKPKPDWNGVDQWISGWTSVFCVLTMHSEGMWKTMEGHKTGCRTNGGSRGARTSHPLTGWDETVPRLVTPGRCTF